MNTYYHSRCQTRRQSGFSLLEVLISIVVTSIGLLGLAGMQVTSLKNNQSAYQNSQAAVLAYDLADRVRANLGNGDATAMYLGSSPNLSDASAVLTCETADGCTAAEMVENDLFKWNAALQAAMPNAGATGAITLTGGVYVINVSWENRNKVDEDDEDFSFEVAFQP